MNVHDINPYIRYAQIIKLYDGEETVCGYDHRFFYILEGKGKLVADSFEYQLKPNTAVLLKSGTPYQFLIEQRIKLLAVNFDYTQSSRDNADEIKPVGVKDFIKTNILEEVCFSECDLLNFPVIKHNVIHIYEKVNLIDETFSKKEIYFNEKCSSALKDVIIEIIKRSVFESDEITDKVSRALDYINENYSKNITNKQISDVVNYHPYHLNRLVKEYTGYTVHQYLMNRRLEHAKKYLSTKNYSIAEIAERCGFSSSYHFSNIFKQKFDCSPNHYRKYKQNLI